MSTPNSCLFSVLYSSRNFKQDVHIFVFKGLLKRDSACLKHKQNLQELVHGRLKF